MKIVFFDYIFERDKPGLSGLSDVVWEMARGLVAAGENVHIVGPFPESAEGPEGTVIHSFNLPAINYRNIVGHMLIVLSGWRTLQQSLTDIDVIHAPEYLSTAFFSVLGSIPVVLTTPGNIYAHIHNGANYFSDPITTAIVKTAARVSARRCASIIAISRDTKHWWELSGAPRSNVVVIPYGVDTERFRLVADARRQMDWSSSEKHLLYVGRLSHEKGPDLLLEALAYIATGRSKVHLHIVGDGSERQALLRQAQQSGVAARVTFHGWVKKSELPLYYAAADVCIVPSRTEALGRVILESMACRTTVVGARIGGIPDLVKDEKTGLLFEAGNAAHLAQKLQLILTQDALIQELAHAGWEFVHREQSWEAVAKRIRDDIYHPIARGALR
jgi:glycosyltransferase involved in cell wall biosynthesis